MLEFILEIIGEFLLQSFIELLIDMGVHTAGQSLRKERSPVASAFWHAFFGALVGGVTLLVFPRNLVHGEALQMLNLIVTPILVGLGMAAMGAWRTQRGLTRLRMDSFWYGYLFAMSLAVVRYFGTH